MPRVLILTNYYVPSTRAGGPVRSIRARAKYSSADIEIMCLDHDHLSDERFPVPHHGRVRIDRSDVTYLPDLNRGGARRIMELYRAIDRADVVWLQSLYSVQFSILPLLWLTIRRRSRRVIISPRGGLAPAAHAHGSHLKPVWDRIIRAFGIDAHAIWMASSLSEKTNILQHFPRARVVVSPEQSLLAGTPLQLRRRSGPLKLLFLGRLHPIKGLAEAIEIVGEMSEPVSLTIAGAHENGDYVKKAEARAAELADKVAFTWLGHVAEEDVPELIRGHDALLAPTAGENYGHAIAESFALGRPVFVADTTPWSFAADDGAAFLISRSDFHWSAEAIDDYARRDWHGVEMVQRSAHGVGSRGLPQALSLDNVVSLLMEEN